MNPEMVKTIADVAALAIFVAGIVMLAYINRRG